jgi:RNA polymerase sigma-70 factor (ECF subfamily)
LSGLTALFERSLPAGQTVAAPVEERLEALWAAARARWPELPDDRDGFVRHLAARIGANRDVAIEAALAGVHGADLYLALHAAHGDPRAIQLVLAGPFAVARAVLIKLRCARELAHDVEQDVRTLLFVGNPGGHPKLADYAGRGELKSWIASITARIARKRLGRDDPAGDVADLTAGGDDPELAYFKDTYREAFEAAVRGALAALSVRERHGRALARGRAPEDPGPHPRGPGRAARDQRRRARERGAAGPQPGRDQRAAVARRASQRSISATASRCAAASP